MKKKNRKHRKRYSLAKKILFTDLLLGVLLAEILLFQDPIMNITAGMIHTFSAETAIAENHSSDTTPEDLSRASFSQLTETAELIIHEQVEEKEVSAAANQERKEREKEQAEEAAEQKAGTSVHLLMAGDVLVSSAIDLACINEEGKYDFNVLFENTSSLLSEYDLKIVNEETACGGGDFGISGYPSFNSPHEVQDAIAAAGFNVVCMATNHMLDLGVEPLYSTLNYWRNVYPDIALTGAYDSQEASDQICYYQKDDFRIAILNYTYGSNAGSGYYYDAPYALNMLYEDEVRSDIRAAKETSDYVIVCPHWGTEYQLYPDDEQAKWADIFLQEGVDLVLGAHPHVPEPIEVYTREDGHQMICYYSLGNYVSNQDYAYSMVGGLADVSLKKTEEGVTVEDYGIIPIVTHQGAYYSAYLLKDYSNELALTSLGAQKDPDFSVEYAQDLVVSLFGDRLRSYSE